MILYIFCVLSPQGSSEQVAAAAELLNPLNFYSTLLLMCVYDNFSHISLGKGWVTTIFIHFPLNVKLIWGIKEHNRMTPPFIHFPP